MDDDHKHKYRFEFGRHSGVSLSVLDREGNPLIQVLSDENKPEPGSLEHAKLMLRCIALFNVIDSIRNGSYEFPEGTSEYHRELINRAAKVDTQDPRYDEDFWHSHASPPDTEPRINLHGEVFWPQWWNEEECRAHIQKKWEKYRFLYGDKPVSEDGYFACLEYSLNPEGKRKPDYYGAWKKTKPRSVERYLRNW